ncbi:MAG: aminoacyl-tRNA hydrolase [Blautia sp.]|nr:aminoacyl-tRNA hydrolase [Blautia sp.]
MYLIAGLGNPGTKYSGTRHNMGFDVVDLLIERHKIPQSGVKFNAMYGKGTINGHKVIVMKPLSYMNLSGGPIQQMAAFFKIDPASRLIVIHDDIDLDPGVLRIRKQGSAGGHNGMKDIIQKLGSEQFCRVRVGVGAKPKDWDLADYVLSRFTPSDRTLVDEALEAAADAVEKIVTEGPDAAMNTFNKKKTVKEKES